MTTNRLQIIERIYLEAKTLAPAQQAAFLEAECAGDAKLRRTLNALLAEDEAGDLFAAAIQGATAHVFEPTDYTGQLIGRYRVQSQLGQGGMGTVWLAKREGADFDQRVAIKFLHGKTAGVTEGFRLERQILAQLSHPNIGLMLDGDLTPEGVPYTVLEYIEGESITEYCRSRKLSVVDKLDLILAVARAIEYIHESGVIHRDIKPNNILVTHRGVPKLLDFGIAKTSGILPVTASLAESQELLGSFFGTAHYLSPEQARGLAIDARSDIFSLGIVIFELFAGKRPFGGESANEVIAAILREEPPRLSQQVRGLPPELDHILGQALTKRPEDRYPNIAALIADLKQLRDRLDEQVRHPHRNAIAAGIVLLVLLAAAIGLWRWVKTRPLIDAVNIVRLTNEGNLLAAHVSSDGQWIAFSDDKRNIFVRRVSDQSARRITQVDTGIWGIRWSPDSRSIVYVTNRAEMERISVNGGKPEKVIDHINCRPDFSPDGKRMVFAYYSATASEVLVSAPDGSGRRIIAQLPHDGSTYISPVWMPDGRHVVVGRFDKRKTGWELWQIDSDTGVLQRVLDRSFPRLLDLAALPSGGLLLAASDAAEDQLQLWLVRNNRAQRLVNNYKRYISPMVTAAGMVAAVESSLSLNLWMGDTDGPLLQVTDGNRAYRNPLWLADGSLLIIMDTDGRREILRLPPVEPADFRSVYQTTDSIGYLSACPDGRTLLFDRSNSRGGGIWKMDLEGGAPLQITTGRYDHQPQCSADSKSMVYTTGDDSLWIPMRVSLTGEGAERIPDVASTGRVSPDGLHRFWYRLEEHNGKSERGISVRGNEGTKWLATGDSANYAWAPDSKGVLFVRKQGAFSNIWLWRLDSDAPRQLTQYQIPDVWSFAPSRDLKKFAVTRGKFESDVVALRANW